MERLLRPLDASAAAGWAAALIAEFGSIGRVMCQSAEACTRVLGTPEAGAFLTSVAEAVHCMLRERAGERPILNNCQALLDYLKVTQGHSGIETSRVLFLNTRTRLLKDEVFARGTVDEAAFWPREIVKRCLELDASAVLLAHNHPSGDPTPSQIDIDFTRRIARQCALFGIRFFDHIIVTDRGHVSMRDEYLI